MQAASVWIRRDKEDDVDNIGKSQAVPSGHYHEAAVTSSKHASDLLDEGLEESFPASDPAAVSITRIIEDEEGS
ncbi:hypothetical protein AB595_06475 [Massilia sp. WF1]|nr:hypothetical protein AM586_21970 [Massilia sp. WG5]KLU37625.1 hypothetical protein AB595_06475 [Massilia sp. WF1]